MATLDLIITAHDKASSVLGDIDKKAGGLGQTLGTALKVGAVGAAAGLAGLGAIGFKCVEAAMEQQAVNAQLAAVLKSTGGAAGLTAKEVESMATSLMKVTTYGDEAIQGGQNLLLTFTKIGKDIFPAATETMLNMSTALGQDVSASAIQLGKALNDPIRGMTALRRVGVSFTKAQEDQVKAMMAVGDIAGAQKLILAELETEFGGAARAAADTFGGRMKQLQNVLGELMETIGFALLPILTKLAQGLSSFLLDHQADIERFAKLIGKGIGEAFEFLGEQIPKAVAWFKSDVLPALKEIAGFIESDVVPQLIDFGRTALEIGKGVAQFLAPALDTLADLWANALKPALDAVLPILKQVGQFLLEHKPLLIAVAAAILLLVAPWLAVVAAIAVVLAKWDEISAFFIGIGETISNFVTGAIETITGLPVIGAIVTDTFNQIKITVETVFEVVKLLISTALDTIKNTFAFWKAIFSGDWGAAWNAVKAQVEVIWNLLSGLFGIALDAIKAMLGSKLEMVKTIGSDLGNAIVNAAKAIWNTIKTIFSDAVNAIGAWVTGSLETFKGWGKTIGQAIVDGFKIAFDASKDLAKGFNNLVIDILNSITQAINDFIPNRIAAIKVFGETIFPGIDLPDNPIPRLNKMQAGGIITRPTLALLGERGPEAVIPLTSPTAMAGGGIDYDRLANTLAPVLARALRGVRIEMDGREVGRVQGQTAYSLMRGG